MFLSRVHTVTVFPVIRRATANTYMCGFLGGCREDKTRLPFALLKYVHICPDLTVIYLPVTQFIVVMIKNLTIGLFPKMPNMFIKTYKEIGKDNVCYEKISQYFKTGITIYYNVCSLLERC